MKIAIPYNLDVDQLIFALQIANSIDNDLCVSDHSLEQALGILDEFTYHLDRVGDILDVEYSNRHVDSSCSCNK